MTIKIPPDIEQHTYQQLSSGRFAEAKEELRAALTTLVNLVTQEVDPDALKGWRILLELVAKLEETEFFDQLNKCRSDKGVSGGIQPGKSTVERLPELFTSPDDSFVPADIPMPRVRIVQTVKAGKRLPEFHGIE